MNNITSMLINLFGGKKGILKKLSEDGYGTTIVRFSKDDKNKVVIIRIQDINEPCNLTLSGDVISCPNPKTIKLLDDYLK